MISMPVLDIYVTGACNLGCHYCFGESDLQSGMSQAVFLDALNFAKHVGANTIEFCGGEPLLYSRFAWAVEQAKKQNFNLILRTNGHYVSRHRSFIAEHFNTVGISLDGDAQYNDMMRPEKRVLLDAAQKFEIPLQEVTNLKLLNPNLQILLASVASKVNLDGLSSLAYILLERQVPIDLWKIHQFLNNNFRAKLNEDIFSLDKKTFKELSANLNNIVNSAFPVICRESDEIDGSCLMVRGNGDLFLGAYRAGSITEDSFDSLAISLRERNAESSITKNKARSYPYSVA